MLLRSGTIYTPVINKKRIRKEIFTKSCLICSLDYKTGDYITSCNKKCISLHSFHINCMISIQKYNINNRLIQCPYCYQLIKTPLEKYRFI